MKYMHPQHEISGATGLTPHQRALKHFIAHHTREHGVAPTFDLMKEALGLKSKSGVHRLLDALEERGHIVRMRYRARAITIIDAPQIDTADALRVVLDRCKMTADTAQEVARLLAAEVAPPCKMAGAA